MNPADWLIAYSAENSVTGTFLTVFPFTRTILSFPTNLARGHVGHTWQLCLSTALALKFECVLFTGRIVRGLKLMSMILVLDWAGCPILAALYLNSAVVACCAMGSGFRTQNCLRDMWG